MATRRILLLSADETGLRDPCDAVSPGPTFSADAGGLAAFANHLATEPEATYDLLVNLPDEDFRAESIPASRGSARTAIVRRRLAQHFRCTPYALALSRGRHPGVRHDESLLLMALTRPQALAPWVETLHAADVALAGIYAVPQLLDHLLPKACPAHLLLCLPTRAGWRQAYFHGGQLRFSRLAPSASDAVAHPAETLHAETVRMRQHLAGQRLLEREQPLAVRVLAHPDWLPALHALCPDDASLVFTCADLHAAARQFGLAPRRDDPHADALLCRLLALKAPAQQFASPAERARHRRNRARRTLDTLGAGVLLLALAASGVLLAEVPAQRAALAQIQPEIVAARERLLQRSPSPHAPLLPAGAAERLVARHTEAQRRAVGPAPLLVRLSHGLDAFPDIAVEAIDWELVEPARHPSTAPSRGPARMHVAARLPTRLYGDPDAQRAAIAGFMAHFAAAPDLSARLLDAPQGDLTEAILADGAAPAASDAPRFAFELEQAP